MKLEVIQPKKTSKYKNLKCWVGGKKFDSKKEGRRFIELCLLRDAGDITLLRTQVVFWIIIKGHKVCSYKADFVYYNRSGNMIVEDVKGIRTPLYKLKKKLLLHTLGIEISEI